MERSITFSDRTFHIKKSSRDLSPGVLDIAPRGCLRFRPVRGGNAAAIKCATFPHCQHPPRTETLAHHA
jgi:hypothetical protein